MVTIFSRSAQQEQQGSTTGFAIPSTRRGAAARMQRSEKLKMRDIKGTSSRPIKQFSFISSPIIQITNLASERGMLEINEMAF